MIQTLKIFSKVPCLTELSSLVSANEIRNIWFRNSDKRNLVQIIQKFIDINKNELDFLNISPILIGSDSSLKIAFKTDRYIGTIPLRSPVNGKQMGDFVVVPRYAKKQDNYGSYIEILNLLDTNLNPEFYNSIPLISGNIFKPPLYFEACKYITLLFKLSKINWIKFQNIENDFEIPFSQVNWEKYVNKLSNPKNRLIFPNKENILTQLHNDYFKLKYVYEIAKSEIQSFRTPFYIKQQMLFYTKQLDQKMYLLKSKVCSDIKINRNDNNTVREVKLQANKILSKNFNIGRAWRIDIAEIFERYVQYIFKEISRDFSSSIYFNFTFNKYSEINVNWGLKYLEPDIIMMINKITFFIDAKYKSNLYNLYSKSEYLKEDHRSDIHQILSYCSFSDLKNKIGILCYPCDELKQRNVVYENKINDVKNEIILIGIPFEKSKVFLIKEYISAIIRNYIQN